jgi:glyoxylase-like metal-dependent hydrolase (beta-lactamase superfamily II)
VHEIARDVAIVPGLIANCYLVGPPDGWVLIDAGTPGNDRKIARAAEKRFGAGSRPQAILLTHGHFDHAGSAAPLADRWGVRIFAHATELPYLTGRQHYPPLDTTKPGFFSNLARFFPSSTVDLGKRVAEFERAPSGWEILETPGHTVGHVSLFRPTDGVLIAGDAVTTMDLDSFVGTIFKTPKVCGPPVPATFDWESARASVRMLAALQPSCIAAGHGSPMRNAAQELSALADTASFSP